MYWSNRAPGVPWFDPPLWPDPQGPPVSSSATTGMSRTRRPAGSPCQAETSSPLGRSAAIRGKVVVRMNEPGKAHSLPGRRAEVATAAMPTTNGRRPLCWGWRSFLRWAVPAVELPPRAAVPPRLLAVRRSWCVRWVERPRPVPFRERGPGSEPWSRSQVFRGGDRVRISCRNEQQRATNRDLLGFRPGDRVGPWTWCPDGRSAELERAGPVLPAPPARAELEDGPRQVHVLSRFGGWFRVWRRPWMKFLSLRDVGLGFVLDRDERAAPQGARFVFVEQPRRPGTVRRERNRRTFAS